jgi:alpha-2-macroglobulin
VFSLLSLGKISRAGKTSTANAVVKMDGKIIGQSKGETIVLSGAHIKGSQLEVIVSGSGAMYYFLESEGISRSANLKEEDQFIKVRRQFYNRNGTSLSGNQFKLNDLIIVEISLSKAYNSAIENIVITDLIPACFEVENPRVKEIPGMNWIKKASHPTHLDIRDDRINLFVDIRGQETQRFYYAVRVVSTGDYRMGPVMAELCTCRISVHITVLEL